MATKQKKTGAAVAAVIGVGALGLGAVALMRSNNSTQKEANTMFSGALAGGGATGIYTDTTGVPGIGETVGGVLSEVLQTTPQVQPAPIIINKTADSGYDDIAPLINNLDNPSDEVSDIKQGVEATRHGESAVLPVSGTAYEAFYSELVNSDQGFTDDGGVYIPSQIGATAKTSKTTTAVEYNPFNFTPTPKQADYSSYNAGKTGGTAVNTPTGNNSPSKEETKFTSNKVYDIGTTTTPQKDTSKSTSYSVTESNPVQTALKATSSFVGGIASTVGNFFGGLFGGR